MRSAGLATAFAACCILLSGAAALGQSTRPALPERGWIGSVTGDPEKDSFGHLALWPSGGEACPGQAASR